MKSTRIKRETRALLERIVPPAPLTQERLALEIRNWTGRIPTAELQDEDVFVIGYPKSGSTWVQTLIAGLVYGVDPEYAPDALIQELVPGLGYKRYYKRYRSPSFFKTHDLPKPKYKRVIYLLRDGRDVMVSYRHFLAALERKPIDFLEMVRDGTGLNPCKWHTHVNAWLEDGTTTDLIVIRYEDLIVNPISELRKLCQFVGIERSDPVLESVTAKASFGKMQKKEREHGLDNPDWPKDKKFIRRGQIGSYRDEMPPEVLDAFLQEAGPTLAKFGYR